MICFEPTPEEAAIRDQVHRFAESDLRRCMHQCEDGSIPEDVVRRFQAMHVGLADLPADVGGLGLTLVTRLLIEEELSWGDAGIAAALPGPGSASYLLAGADQTTRRLWCESAGTSRVALALGAQAREAELRLEDGSGRVALAGALPRVAHGPDAEHIVACARDGEHLAVLWLRNEPGRFGFVAESPRLGLRALRTFVMTADGAPLRPEEIVARGTAARVARSDAVRRARMVAAASAVGAARAACEYATRYALERRAFGKPIAEHQAVAFMIAEMAINVDAARSCAWYAAASIAAGGDDARSVELACGHVNAVAVDVCSNAVQVLGGHGYVQDHPVEMWLRDTQTLATWWSEERQLED